MMDLRTFLRMCLKKKGYTYETFCNEVNCIKFQLGDKGIIRNSNLSNILNGDEGVSDRTLLIFEKALGLPENTLVNMNNSSKSINSRRYRKKISEELYEKN